MPCLPPLLGGPGQSADTWKGLWETGKWKYHNEEPRNNSGEPSGSRAWGFHRTRCGASTSAVGRNWVDLLPISLSPCSEWSPLNGEGAERCPSGLCSGPSSVLFSRWVQQQRWTGCRLGEVSRSLLHGLSLLQELLCSKTLSKCFLGK